MTFFVFFFFFQLKNFLIWNDRISYEKKKKKDVISHSKRKRKESFFIKKKQQKEYTCETLTVSWMEWLGNSESKEMKMNLGAQMIFVVYDCVAMRWSSDCNNNNDWEHLMLVTHR